MRTIFASFLKFYSKEYEEIKHIPVSRFWGYIDFMGQYNKSQEELIDEQKKKFEKVKNADWTDEVRELKNGNN